MSSDKKTPAKAGNSKEQRLKQALKANMARRKAQARARSAPPDDVPANAPSAANDKGQA